jgi:DNA-binding LacI/PurR family transcriptional regulator
MDNGKIHGRTTIRDVSRLADVSVATVSAVINGKPAVSETLTQRVRRAIAALNYQPDYLARSLRMQRSNILGIVMPQFASPYYAEVLRGVEDVASGHGYSILVSNSRGDAERERKEIFVLVSRRVDGILLATADPHFAYQRQFSQRFPLVLFDRFPPAFTGTVVATDNIEASFEATNHLIQLGHKRIAIIAGARGISTADERIEGFRRAMNEASLTVRQEFIKHGDFNMKGGWECALGLMKLPSPPTAIFSHNYEMTLGLMRALAEIGVPCPQQVSVLGFDDFVVGMDGFSWATMFSPKVSCVAQPSYEVGRRAAQALLKKTKKIDGQDHSEEGFIRLRAELRIRESTAPPPSL